MDLFLPLEPAKKFQYYSCGPQKMDRVFFGHEKPDLPKRESKGSFRFLSHTTESHDHKTHREYISLYVIPLSNERTMAGQRRLTRTAMANSRQLNLQWNSCVDNNRRNIVGASQRNHNRSANSNKVEAEVAVKSIEGRRRRQRKHDDVRRPSRPSRPHVHLL
jgi:hypothetical protein